MKINLISYTGIGQDAWAAADVLIFTKSTRLNMTSDLFENIQKMSNEEKLKELEYMSNTIPSSWEFVDYIFSIEGVTRAFTHQFVRSRNNSYAQQTMRILNVDGFTCESGPTINTVERLKKYESAISKIKEVYSELIDMGVAIEDARGILPTNIHTNITAKINLRSLAEMAQKRSSPRTQGEYRQVLDAMIDSVLLIHPWAELFLRNKKIYAAKKMDEFINNSFDPMYGEHLEEKSSVLKLVDILRS